MINDKYSNLDKYLDKFRSSKPFPYLILDNFFKKSFYNQLCTELSHGMTKIIGKEFNTSVEKNKTINLNNDLPKTIDKTLYT